MYLFIKNNNKDMFNYLFLKISLKKRENFLYDFG